MSEPIEGGSFLVARKIYASNIWLKHPFYLKVWLWILGQANHSDHQKGGKQYRRGELITSYNEILKGVAYYYRHRFIYPTIKQLRDILKWLETEGMIIIQPLRKDDFLTQEILLNRADLGADLKGKDKADLKGRERAYIGIKIFIMNYDTYQNLLSYKRTEDELGEKADQISGEKTGGFSLIGHNNNNVKNDEDIYIGAAKKIIDHLNDVGLRKFSYCKANIRFIVARLKEGHTIDECKQVIETKWNDPDFLKKYFRPETLFRPGKFEGYLNEKTQKRWDHAG